MGFSNQEVDQKMLSYSELWTILELVDKKKIFSKLLIINIILSTILVILNITTLATTFSNRATIAPISQFLSMINSLLYTILLLSIIIFVFTLSSDNKISFHLFIFHSLPAFLLNFFTNNSLKIALGDPDRYSGFFYTKNYLAFVQDLFWQYGIIFAILMGVHLTRWFFEKGILGTTHEKMSIEEASQLIKGMIMTRKLVDIEELSRLTGQSKNIWTAKIYQLTGAGVIDGEFDGFNFIPKTKDVEYLADQLVGKTVVVEGVGNFKPCCYNAARVGDTYCMCGLVIPDELRKYVGS